MKASNSIYTMETILNLLAAGLFLAATTSAYAATLYVSLASTNPTPPYATWATAATNIQDAVDVAVAGDEILVTNGTYAAGCRVDPTGATNRLGVTSEAGNDPILQYCCTTPLPPGTGNIAADPRLTDSAHVSSDSPCVGAGNFTYVSGTDIDGEAWANPPSIGCDEFHAGAVTGPLTLTVAADYTNAAAGFVLHFTGQINGHALVNFWDFDDGTFAVNEAGGWPHSFATPGDYTVTLWAYNDSHLEGVSASLAIHVDSGLHCVSATSPNPVAPYASWATAATNIQDAVDTAGVGGTILVTNGTYASGGRAGPDPTTSRVVLDKPVTLRSVNGPEATIIDGAGGVRCVYLTNDAAMIGFTLTNGVADNGGGVYCESTSAVLSNCVLTGNSAGGGNGQGGGAYACTLHNCTLSGNWAGSGAGAYDCTLNNCSVTGNSAVNEGGGAWGGTLKWPG